MNFSTFAFTLRNEFSFITGNYQILVLSWIVMDFAGEIAGTYYPLYVLALGGTPATIGLIALASSLALAAVQFPGGYLADRYGRRWLVSTMTFAVAFTYLFYALAPSWHFILIGAVLGSLFLIYQPALLALIADALPPEKRGVGYSIITLITHAATTPGPLVAGLLYVTYGLVNGVRIGYLMLVGFFLIAAILRSRLRETVREPRKIRVRELLGVYPTSLKESVKVWRAVPASMRYLFLANLLASLGSAMIMPFLVIYAVQDLKITEIQWSVLLTLVIIGLIVFAYPAGKFIDLYGRKKSLMFAYLVNVPAMLLFVYGDFFRLLVAALLRGVTGVMSHAAFDSLQADLVPREQRGKIIGSSNFVINVITAPGAFIGGLAYEAVSHRLPFFLLLGLVIPQVILVILFIHESERKQE